MVLASTVATSATRTGAPPGVVFTTSCRSPSSIVHLRAHQAQDELMVGFVQARRVTMFEAWMALTRSGMVTPAACSRARLGTTWNSGTWPPCTVTVLTPATRFSGGFRS